MTDPAEPQLPLLLYVEDELLIQNIVIDCLEDAGYRLVIADSGEEALKLLSAHRAELRGMITDINLGEGLDGWEIARTARQSIDGLPVVYVSAASHDDWSSQGVPGSVMIAKPFATSQLVVAISSLLVVSDS
ncbi:MAG: response regulator [Sphingomonadales bacterium]